MGDKVNGELMVQGELSPATVEAIEAWCEAVTDMGSDSALRSMQNKGRRLLDFFQTTGTTVATATPGDVKRWQEALLARGLKQSTIYNYTSFLSSFYAWALDEERGNKADALPFGNIAGPARTKAPEPYREARALTQEELDALIDVIRDEASEGSLTAKRDFAILDMFLTTSRRRSEVLRLRWRDLVRTNGHVQVTFVVKGGDKRVEEVDAVWYERLLDYLRAAGRLDDMTPDEPLWRGHDRAGMATGPLNSHSFAKNLKAYWRRAGLTSRVHIHGLRHTVASRLYERTGGDIGAVSYQLGHATEAMTKRYIHSIATHTNKYQALLRSEFGL